MFTVYNIALFLHVAAFIIWIGGLVAIGILYARLSSGGRGRQTFAQLLAE